MSKKDKKEEEINQTTDDVETTEPTPSKKEVKKDNEKYTLLDLLRQTDNNTAFIRISEKGYFEQYLNELSNEEKGFYIEPTLTKKEFEKIIQN